MGNRLYCPRHEKSCCLCLFPYLMELFLPKFSLFHTDRHRSLCGSYRRLVCYLVSALGTNFPILSAKLIRIFAKKQYLCTADYQNNTQLNFMSCPIVFISHPPRRLSVLGMLFIASFTSPFPINPNIDILPFLSSKHRPIAANNQQHFCHRSATIQRPIP